MAKFDQRGQQVVNQINADVVNQVNAASVGNVSFGIAQNKAEFISELQKLIFELNKATQAGIIQKGISIDIEAHIKKVMVELEESKPKKNVVIEHLEGAKKLLDGITSASGLVSALIQAAEIARKFFG